MPLHEPLPIDLAPLERYAPIVDDVAAFLAASRTPLPRVVWANPLRTSVAAAEAEVMRHCPTAEPLSWLSRAWRLPPDARPGRWPAYALGWLHGQEEAALWAASVLAPKPGERVLDLCAAPGNKTAQIAVLMQDSGTIVANDGASGRLVSLRFNLERLGVSAAVVTHRDGTAFPMPSQGYDRVLVDAPCTCEGTTRKGSKRRLDGDAKRRVHAHDVQRQLLARAVALTRPGGTIVYATCTYAPEENEAVLDTVPEQLATIEPFEPPEGAHDACGRARVGRTPVPASGRRACAPRLAASQQHGWLLRREVAPCLSGGTAQRRCWRCWRSDSRSISSRSRPVRGG